MKALTLNDGVPGYVRPLGYCWPGKVLMRILTALVALMLWASIAQAGQLSGTFQWNPSSPRDLTAEGTSTWIHWGYNSATDVTRKANALALPTYSKIYSFTESRTTTTTAFSWTDGTPQRSATGHRSGVQATGLSRGFQVTIPADTIVRTAKIYVGAIGAIGQLPAS